MRTNGYPHRISLRSCAGVAYFLKVVGTTGYPHRISLRSCASSRSRCC
uniref:Uncharacterized protein n=1 Tax=Janibacter limosus TaxID=53458 RepID=A0AC61U162_9MICO|nr:hypothetical protein [Janibacter limosus]